MSVTIPECGGILAGWTLILAVAETAGRAPREIHQPGGAEPRFPKPGGSARPARRWPAGSAPGRR